MSDVRHRVFVRAAAALFVLALLVHAVTAAEITGRVVGIADGDTLTILDADHRQTKVRLAEIDAPESHQPYGTRAKQVLSELVFGRDVRVVVVDIDRYGRTVGRIYAGALDVSAEMVRQGAAWVFIRYNHDPSLAALEQAAQAARRGLWALPEAERVPPWEWRANARAARLRHGVPPLPLAGHTAVIVDDGLATGGTARAAVAVSRARGAARVVVAVPVAPRETVELLAREADEGRGTRSSSDTFATASIRNLSVSDARNPWA